MNQDIRLKRAITLPMLVAYGLGTIIGAGIFVLMGEVAGIVGIYTPISFLLASIVAGFTAFSYAELSSRFPKSAGEAIYLEETFHIRWLSTAVGFAISIIGIVSAATITNGSIGYIQVFVALPDWLIRVLLVTGLSLLAIWGISESVKAAVASTLVSVTALLVIIFINTDSLLTLPARLPELIPPADAEILGLIIMGAFVAFYAFIGFEDMINVAEEVHEPSRNMPKAIALALLLTTVLYVLVALTAVLAVPLDTLVNSDAPLMVLIGDSQPYVIVVVGLVSIFAVADGILIQIIKTSRILFGLSRQGMIHALFADVHPKTRTPIFSTLFVAVAVFILATAFPIITLAKFTSFLTLSVFAAINFTLWRLKLRPETRVNQHLNLPLWAPVVAFVVSSAFILLQLLYLFK